MGGIWGPIGHALVQAKNGRKAKVAYVSTNAANHMFVGVRNNAKLQHLRKAGARLDDGPHIAGDTLNLSKPKTGSNLGLGHAPIPPKGPPTRPGAVPHPPLKGAPTKPGAVPHAPPKGIPSRPGAAHPPAKGQPGGHATPNLPRNDMQLLAAEKELKEALAIERADMRALEKRLSNWKTQKEHNIRHHQRAEKDQKYAAAWSRAKSAIERLAANQKGAINGYHDAKQAVASAMRELSGALADMAGV